MVLLREGFSVDIAENALEGAGAEAMRNINIWFLVWRKFSISAYAGRILPYEFPWLQMGVYVVVLVTVELILSVWTIRRQKKQSLIEQMRAME